jgi:hypothetical protein
MLSYIDKNAIGVLKFGQFIKKALINNFQRVHLGRPSRYGDTYIVHEFLDHPSYICIPFLSISSVHMYIHPPIQFNVNYHASILF